MRSRGLSNVTYMSATCRWAESHRTWPDGKPWYEDTYGALWVDACIPEDQQKRMRQWKAEVWDSTCSQHSFCVSLQVLWQQHH